MCPFKTPKTYLAFCSIVYNDDVIMDLDIHKTPPQFLAEHEGFAAAANQRTSLWPGGVVPYELASSIRE